jgi:hypothetical protein
MRSALVLAALVAIPAAAHAQPGPDSQPDPQQPQPQPPPPPGSGPYAPGPYAPGPYAPPGGPGAPGYGPPPAYAYQPTPEEQQLLADGYIDPMRTAIGGVASIFVGFGIGQGVEGRWHDTGWIFTLGETASLAAIIGGAIGVANCGVTISTCQGGDNASGGFLVGGLVALVGFRIWEMVDAFVGPGIHNDHVHEVRRRLGYRDYAKQLVPYINRPQSSDGGMTAGLSLRF